MFRISWGIAWALLLATFSTSTAQENRRHIVLDARFGSIATLDQKWTHQESNWFYNTPQGSRLIPYDWFINLEQADSQEKFAAAKNIRKLGYIPRKQSDENPDALPIGFVQDAPYEDGTRGLGVTCAACHTGQIIHDNVAYIVDGAPTMGDFEMLLKELSKSLEKTAADNQKFGRFSDAVLGAGAAENDKQDLLIKLNSIATQRREYNQRNLPDTKANRYGHGRVDAFGAIFNEVSANFLGIKENVAAADAPVSYPCLWDTPQHDRVQWNGAALNRKAGKLGKTLFGTEEVGALGRNAGEVLGVFGHVEINPKILPPRYESTVNKANLIELENHLRTLWSPKWPEAMGGIDETRRLRGLHLYCVNCKNCHELIDRKSPDRTVIAQMWDEKTDPKMANNFARTGETGRLAHRLISFPELNRFGSQARVGHMLRHVVQRSILEKSLDLAEINGKIALMDAVDADALNPVYENTTVHEVDGKQIRIRLDKLGSLTDGSISKKELIELGREVLAQTAGHESAESSPERISEIRNLLTDAVKRAKPLVAESPAAATPAPPKPSFAYKARPLNGVWATAPYLHNGSVRTLAELLNSPEKREPKFHVGSQVFDPAAVGFMNDDSFPEFDTTIEGNWNAGHDHGCELMPDEKLDLLEYLKSL